MRLAAVILLHGLASAAFMQAAPTEPTDRAHIRFTVENPTADPAAYSLEIYEDGSGSYMASASQSAGRPIRIHDPLLSSLFKAAREDHFFGMECESPRSHVAFSGKKTLAYAGPDGRGSCTFNYSREQTLNRAATGLVSVAYTLSVGARLETEQQHDRLSLDSELRTLQEAVQDHQALEVGNIAPELRSIAADDAVMERARAVARELLSEAATAR